VLLFEFRDDSKALRVAFEAAVVFHQLVQGFFARVAERRMPPDHEQGTPPRRGYPVRRRPWPCHARSERPRSSASPVCACSRRARGRISASSLVDGGTRRCESRANGLAQRASSIVRVLAQLGRRHVRARDLRILPEVVVLDPRHPVSGDPDRIVRRHTSQGRRSDIEASGCSGAQGAASWRADVEAGDRSAQQFAAALRGLTSERSPVRARDRP
jgi:hypothetical protein